MYWRKVEKDILYLTNYTDLYVISKAVQGPLFLSDMAVIFFDSIGYKMTTWYYYNLCDEADNNPVIITYRKICHTCTFTNPPGYSFVLSTAESKHETLYALLIPCLITKAKAGPHHVIKPVEIHPRTDVLQWSMRMFKDTKGFRLCITQKKILRVVTFYELMNL
jgi:hypothetical protein